MFSTFEWGSWELFQEMFNSFLKMGTAPGDPARPVGAAPDLSRRCNIFSLLC